MCVDMHTFIHTYHLYIKFFWLVKSSCHFKTKHRAEGEQMHVRERVLRSWAHCNSHSWLLSQSMKSSVIPSGWNTHNLNTSIRSHILYHTSAPLYLQHWSWRKQNIAKPLLILCTKGLLMKGTLAA